MLTQRQIWLGLVWVAISVVVGIADLGRPVLFLALMGATVVWWFLGGPPEDE